MLGQQPFGGGAAGQQALAQAQADPAPGAAVTRLREECHVMFDVLPAEAPCAPPELPLGVVAADCLPLPVAPIVGHHRRMLHAAWATLVQWHAHAQAQSQARPL